MKLIKKIIIISAAAVFAYGTLASATTSTETFNYTGATSTWTDPAGVFSITVNTSGGKGGDGGGGQNTGHGGYGGSSTGTVSVTPGTAYCFAVGQSGVNNGANTFAGAGIGLATNNDPSGGGMTWFGLLTACNNATGTIWAKQVLLVGAGGGGSGNTQTGASTDSYGGGLTGGNGTLGNASTISTGGTQSAGGSGGTGSAFNGLSGTAGQGGGCNDTNGANASPGCGGGGYFGGGGGGTASGNTPEGSGGGGSSFASSTLVANTTSTTNGLNNATGTLTISYQTPVPVGEGPALFSIKWGNITIKWGKITIDN